MTRPRTPSATPVAPRTPHGPVTPPTAAPPAPAVPDRRSYLVRSLLAGILLGAQQNEQQRPGQADAHTPPLTRTQAPTTKALHRTGTNTAELLTVRLADAGGADRGPGHHQMSSASEGIPMTHPLTTPDSSDRNPDGHNIFDPAPTRVNHAARATDTTSDTDPNPNPFGTTED
ncbi:MAG: hypothetical protein ACXWZL_01415, partial [Mycobacterium sp.]